MRNSIREKEMVVRELERKIVQLEQHNKELGDLLKELREAQINNGGANSVTSKLHTSLDGWKRGRADLDKAFDIKENEDVVLISAEQLRVKDKSVKTMAQAAQQHYLLEEEPKQQKKKLEESSEGQLILEEQLLQMEYTVQYERNAAFEALEVLEQEIAMDVANGKQRHIPYRDSRLTFLLQAVVNEDSTGDVIALQHQIRLLKEELSILKRRQNVSRSLSFSLSSIRDIKQSLELEDCCLENATDMVDQHEDNMPNYESKGIRMSHKQVYMGRLGYVNEG
ncbi:Kinesin-like protein KIN-12F [Glycine soja]|uniref:Kinesin-like protein KIN-12F n=1 Tax=Glycine soja TaxID=3848 RepID=A0A445G8V8_GLYSO|nr:Kinesin-like protein KIN-12F [Glycine soja]